MPTATKTRPSDTATAAANLTRLEAELANLPVDIEAAEIAGDETRLSSLLARERILARQVVSARREALEAEIAELGVALHTARVERDAADVKLERFELAVAVYTEAANRIRLGEGNLAMQRFSRLQERMFRLQDRLDREVG